MGEGTVDHAPVYPREVMRRALELAASACCLVHNDGWKAAAEPGRRFRQGHIARAGETSVRARRADDRAFIIVKGERAGIPRPEFEYEIPVSDAEEMLSSLCEGPLLEKTRYNVEHAGPPRATHL